MPELWSVFEAEVENIKNQHVLNIFISREAIDTWAEHLGLKVVGYFDANKKLLPNMTPTALDNGVLHDNGVLGQSVCVLTK
jgi:hypothetical protein